MPNEFYRLARRLGVAFAFACLALIVLPSAQGAGELTVSPSTQAVSLEVNTANSITSDDTDARDVSFVVRNVGDTATVMSPQGSATFSNGATASCGSCGSITLNPGQQTTVTYTVSVGPNGEDGSNSQTLRFESADDTATATIQASVNHIEPGRIEISKVSESTIHMACSPSASTTFHQVRVRFENVGDAIVRNVDASIGADDVTPTPTTRFFSSIGATESEVLELSLSIPRTTPLSSMVVDARADYDNAKQIDLSESERYILAINKPLELEMSASPGWSNVDDNEWVFDFGQVPFGDQATTTARFQEACGYWDSDLTITGSNDAEGSGTIDAQALPAANGTAARFQVQFSTDSGSNVCNAKSWSYTIKASAIGGGAADALRIETWARPGFRDIAPALNQLQVAIGGLPADGSIQSDLAYIHEQAQKGSQGDTGSCRSQLDDITTLLGLVPQFSYLTESLTTMESELANGQYDAAANDILASVTVAATSQQACSDMKRSDMGAACKRVATEFVARFEEIAEALVHHLEFSVGQQGLTQRESLNAFSSLTMVYLARNDLTQANFTLQQEELWFQALEQTLLEADETHAQIMQAHANGQPFLFVRPGDAYVVWFPLRIGDFNQWADDVSTLYEHEVQLLSEAGAAESLQAEYALFQENVAESRFVNWLVAATWGLIIVGSTVQGYIGANRFLKDKHLINLGDQLMGRN